MADIPQKTRAEIEAAMAADLAELNAGLANQLALHLKANPADPQIPDTFWGDLESENQKLLALWLLLTWGESSRRHGWPDRDNQEAGRRWAERRAEEVARKFTETTKNRVETAVRQWKEEQAKAEKQAQAKAEPPKPLKPGDSSPKPSAPQAPKTPRPIPPEAIDEKVDEILGPDRAATVAVTETSNAVTDASDAAMDAQGLLGDDDAWEIEDGSACEICKSVNGLPRSRWPAHLEAGPPAHPNCRCRIRYQNEDAIMPTGDFGVSHQAFGDFVGAL